MHNMLSLQSLLYIYIYCIHVTFNCAFYTCALNDTFQYWSSLDHKTQAPPGGRLELTVPRPNTILFSDCRFTS